MSTTQPTMIPLSKLVASDKNQRKTNKAPNVEALAASILSLGVLQNLVVYEAEDGTYPVVAGERRWSALQLLVERGQLPADVMVPCSVRSVSVATAASLAENVQREAMHPADEFEAFRTLKSEGKTIDDIADAFGVTPVVVERRLKLSVAAPKLLEAFRRDEISTDQLIALCTTDDHKRQLQVWDNARRVQWMTAPRELRKSVLGEDVDVSTDKRVGFIGGLEAYRQAGGEVRRDLFTGDGSGGFITNVALLDKLVADRLEREAEVLRGWGWGWVEIWTCMDQTAFDRLGHAPMSDCALSEADRAKVKALEDEAERLSTEYQQIEVEDGQDDLTEEQSARIDEIDDRLPEIDDEIHAIRAAARSYAPEVKALSGALVIYTNGAVKIERGMVRAADRKAVAKAAGEKVEGGRETESAGRKDGSALSDALRRSLLGHRTLAAQIVTASRPDVAKILLACWTVMHIRCHCGSEHHFELMPRVPTDIGNGANAFSINPISDDAGKAKHTAFKAQALAAIKALPRAMDDLWDALAGQTSAELDALIAYGVALSVNLSDNGKGLTNKLIAALELDMAVHFAPTVENYFGRVSKELMVEAIREGGGVEKAEADALLAMKKSALAAEAEKRIAGSGWVPKLIRIAPKAKKPATPKAPAAKPAEGAKAKPAPAKKPSKPATKKAAA